MCRLPQLLLFLSFFSITTASVASQDCINLWVQPYGGSDFSSAQGQPEGTLICRARFIAPVDGLPVDAETVSRETEGLPTLASLHDKHLNRRVEQCYLKPMVVSSCNLMAHCHDDPPPKRCTPKTLSSGFLLNLSGRRLGITIVLEHEWTNGKSLVAEGTFTPDELARNVTIDTNRSGAEKSARNRREDVLTFSIGPRLYFGGNRDSSTRYYSGASFVTVAEPAIEIGTYPFVGLQTTLTGRRFDFELGYRDVEGSRLDGFAVKVRLRFGKK